MRYATHTRLWLLLLHAGELSQAVMKVLMVHTAYDRNCLALCGALGVVALGEG